MSKWKKSNVNLWSRTHSGGGSRGLRVFTVKTGHRRRDRKGGVDGEREKDTQPPELTSEEHKYRPGSRTLNVQKPLLHIWRCRHEYNPILPIPSPIPLSLLILSDFILYLPFSNVYSSLLLASSPLLSFASFPSPCSLVPSHPSTRDLRKFHPVLHQGGSSVTWRTMVQQP